MLSSLTIRSSQAMTNTSLTVAAAVGCLPRDGPQSAEHVDIDCMQHTSTRRLLEAAHTVGHQERWRPSVDGVHLKNSDPLAALRSSGASQSLDSVLLGANANDASSLLYERMRRLPHTVHVALPCHTHGSIAVTRGPGTLRGRQRSVTM